MTVADQGAAAGAAHPPGGPRERAQRHRGTRSPAPACSPSPARAVPGRRGWRWPPPEPARESFPAGVCWVELAQIEDPASSPQTVAARLGVPDTPGQDAIEAVAEHVGRPSGAGRAGQLRAPGRGAASLTENLLAACPALTVLATSREALGVEGELNWQVPPLSLPQTGTAPTAARAGRFDAVKLFEQRAQLVRPSFRRYRRERRRGGLRSASGSTACRWPSSWPRRGCGSCPRLSWPSGWTTSSPCWSAARAPRHPRHQALRATLDWSHDMLDADERAVFRRLATFAGGFTLEAAERVAAGGDIKPAAMLELLTRLADKSLLRVDHTRGELALSPAGHDPRLRAGPARRGGRIRPGAAGSPGLLHRAGGGGRGPHRRRRGGRRRPRARARPARRRAAQPAEGV